MRKAASSSLASNLKKPVLLSRNPNLLSRIPISNFISDLASQNLSPTSLPYLAPRSESHSLRLFDSRNPNRIPFSIHAHFRAIQTLPSITSPSELEGDPDPLETLESAVTSKEILIAFEALESSFGEDYTRVGQGFDSSGSEYLVKALNLALRALKVLEREEGGRSLSVVKALRLMGSLNFSLKRLGDALDCLDTAEEILGRLELDGLAPSDIGPISVAVQLQLASTKTVMGRRRDALVNLWRSVELKEAILEPNSRELGSAYKDLAEAYTAVLDFKEALPLCLKALVIRKSELGDDSIEVAQIRRLLGVVYFGLEENEKALEQNELSRAMLKSLESEDELIDAEIEGANVQIAMGRLDEAINTLKGTIHQTGKESEARAFVLASLAKALCSQEKFGDSKRCLEMSCSILGKIELVSPLKVAEVYAEISMLYEMMNDFEIALSLMKRTLAILEKLPQEQHLEGSISARIGWLLLLTGRVQQAVPYLERAVERLKKSFGPKHFGIGFVYKHLGQAYLEMDQPQVAVQMLALAKDIICTLFGSHHEDSIDTFQSLANAYGAMGRYTVAMEFQQQVVDAWERHGSRARDELREAHRLLEQLKKKSQGSPSAVFPANTLPIRFPLK